MDRIFIESTRLLLSVAPLVFNNSIFAMKGGTAINLFIQDMPRLSVDIDIVYLRAEDDWKQSLESIRNEFLLIAERVKQLGISARPSGNLESPKLFLENADIQVKIEINTVFRGTILPVEHRRLSQNAADMFGLDITVPTLQPDELYAGKLVAALDRQHPRDLFDVMHLFRTSDLTDRMIECFVIYLAGHNRPIHEVLFSNDKDVSELFKGSFAGMTQNETSLDVLLSARARLREELLPRLSLAHRQFLYDMTKGTPDWALLKYPHVGNYPALRWKLLNLEKFKANRPEEFANQANKLQAHFSALKVAESNPGSEPAFGQRLRTKSIATLRPVDSMTGLRSGLDRLLAPYDRIKPQEMQPQREQEPEPDSDPDFSM